MTIRLNQIEIENFRGINKAKLEFNNNLNFIIGNNGTGKTSLLAAISRLIPILRKEERIFLDSDFQFYNETSSKQIKITYYFQISTRNITDKFKLLVTGTRINSGRSNSNLNDQKPAMIEIILFKNEQQITVEILALKNLKQRIIQNGWKNRISPISVKQSNSQMHAATYERDEQGYFDSLRARLIEKLLKTNLGQTVSQNHPELSKNILEYTNKFLNEEKFIDFGVTDNKQLFLIRNNKLVQPWIGLSSGEQSAFNFAMAIEFEKIKENQIIILEEPECNLHPTIQIELIKKLSLPTYESKQIFIATHSPYIFKQQVNNSKIIITRKNNIKIQFENNLSNKSIFNNISWGEINYFAYNLATFEFHNELYGWLQSNSKKWSEKAFENYLRTNIPLVKMKCWSRIKNDNPQPSEPITLMTYIRNYTHHPENELNNEYTEEELNESIKVMLNLISKIKT